MGALGLRVSRSKLPTAFATLPTAVRGGVSSGRKMKLYSEEKYLDIYIYSLEGGSKGVYFVKGKESVQSWTQAGPSHRCPERWTGPGRRQCESTVRIRPLGSFPTHPLVVGLKQQQETLKDFLTKKEKSGDASLDIFQ